MKIDIPYQVKDYEYLEGYHYINGDVRKIFMLKGILICQILYCEAKSEKGYCAVKRLSFSYNR